MLYHSFRKDSLIRLKDHAELPNSEESPLAPNRLTSGWTMDGVSAAASVVALVETSLKVVSLFFTKAYRQESLGGIPAAISAIGTRTQYKLSTSNRGHPLELMED